MWLALAIYHYITSHLFRDSNFNTRLIDNRSHAYAHGTRTHLSQKQNQNLLIGRYSISHLILYGVPAGWQILNLFLGQMFYCPMCHQTFPSTFRSRPLDKRTNTYTCQRESRRTKRPWMRYEYLTTYFTYFNVAVRKHFKMSQKTRSSPTGTRSWISQ